MGLGAWLRGGPLGKTELARRLGLMPTDLREARPTYETFTIPKRTGGVRTIAAPDSRHKELQRRVLHRLLGALEAHPAAHGFERGRSIVTHARRHVGKVVVVRLDIRDFFPSTSAKRVKGFFRSLGWDRATAGMLTTWCAFEGALPQGAPTSPRLSNLLNRRLDARLAGVARSCHAAYSRYADDLTFSWDAEDRDDVQNLLSRVRSVVQAEGYRLHGKKKLHIMRAHHRQQVTGLVVNDRVGLPRATRRWLRAVEHRHATTGQATLTEAQIQGWRALSRMVEMQRAAPD